MRKLLTLLLAPLLVAVLGVASFAAYVGWSFVTARVDTVGEVDFDRPLAIPPLADSTVAADGTRVFRLEMAQGQTDFGLGPTPTWGINAVLPRPHPPGRGGRAGPRRGDEPARRGQQRPLARDAPSRADGRRAPSAGGAGRDLGPALADRPARRDTVVPPHPHGRTADHVYRGLSGLFYLDDPDSVTSLPLAYGVDDVPLIVQDKNFDGNELDTSSSFLRNAGIFGDTILVNGTPGPYLDVTTERIRLRLSTRPTPECSTSSSRTVGRWR